VPWSTQEPLQEYLLAPSSMLVVFLFHSQVVGRMSMVNLMVWYTRTSLLAMFVLYKYFFPSLNHH
jgi:hypothetical protein